MAGFVALSTNNDVYLGTYKSDESNGIENGQWVTLDHKTNLGKLATASTGDNDVYFVENENTDIVEQAKAEVEFKVQKGEYLRLSKPQAGTIYVTTNFNGTLAEGDEVAVGANGQIGAIGSRTPNTKFVVKQKTTEFGKAALRLLTL